MIKVLINTMNFLAERARGLILSLTGASVGTTAEVVSKSAELTPFEKWAYVTTTIVAILTIISYGYKFYVFVKENRKKK
jgi:hypothetical protein